MRIPRWRLSSAGRASALQAEGRGFEPLSLHHLSYTDAGWSSPVARRAHNPKAAGSNPAPAIVTFLVESDLEPWCSWPNMPACHAGDRGFESRRFRHSLQGSWVRIRWDSLNYHLESNYFLVIIGVEVCCRFRHFILIMRKWLSGRASPCQGEGRGFDSRLPLQYLRP